MTGFSILFLLFMLVVVNIGSISAYQEGDLIDGLIVNALLFLFWLGGFMASLGGFKCF